MTPKRKTAPYKRGKKTLSEAKDNLIVGIPLISRLGPIVVQPQTVGIAFQVEDIRIAIAISYVHHAINTTAHLIS